MQRNHNWLITIDAAAAATAAMSVGVLSASGVVTVAPFRRVIDVTEGIISNKRVVFDGTNSTGTVTINQLTASGATTLSVGAGNFSAGAVDVMVPSHSTSLHLLLETRC